MGKIARKIIQKLEKTGKGAEKSFKIARRIIKNYRKNRERAEKSKRKKESCTPTREK